MFDENLDTHFVKLANHCGVTIFVFDLVALRNVWTTRSMEERLGYSAEEFAALGRGWIRAVLHPEDLERYLADNVRYMQAPDEEPVRTEYRFRHKDGHYVWLASWATVVGRTGDGKPARALGVSIDVTAQKKAAEEKRALEDRLRATQRLESLGRLAGGVAHDFNNLLTIMLGAVHTLEGEPRSEAANTALTEMNEAVERAVRLTRQLLSFARRESSNPRPTDLNAVIGQVLPLARRLLPEDIEIETELAPHLPLVSVDPVQIEQVLMNLVTNARDAMSSAGNLRLRTAARQAEVVVSVEDTGVGMDAATQARIFEPFFTTKARGTASGLGLAVSFGIIDQHGGSIEVDSAPGAGARFHVILPALAAGAPGPAGTGRKSRAPARPAGRLLIVEDEPLILAVAVRVLEGAGYLVTSASSGAEALALVRPGAFDLVLTDVVMPGMNGRDLAYAARLRDPALAVLYMSGYADEILNRDELRTLDFLPKPFTPADLIAAVRRTLAGGGWNNDQ